MTFKYKKLKNPHSVIQPVKLSPMIMVELSNTQNNKRSYMSNALIDSGADHCLIKSDFGKLLLNVDYKTGILEKTMGVDGVTILDVYFHDVNLSITGLPQITIPFGFVDSKGVNILLGRMGFFENFKISFDQKNNTIEIN